MIVKITHFVYDRFDSKYNRYDLYFDNKNIVSVSRVLPYELPDLFRLFWNYMKNYPDKILESYKQQNYFSFDGEQTIFEKDMPDMELFIKKLKIQQKMNEINEDFV